jgi:hypothetical protein
VLRTLRYDTVLCVTGYVAIRTPGLTILLSLPNYYITTYCITLGYTTIFADADHARCLRTRRSISAYFILYNGVLVSWACKKQPVTALHSTAA